MRADRRLALPPAMAMFVFVIDTFFWAVIGGLGASLYLPALSVAFAPDPAPSAAVAGVAQG